MSAWVSFLVRDIDAKLLRRMKKDARAEKCSLSDHMRSILCEHYELDCPPSGSGTRLEFGARTQLLRLQPDLWQAIKTDSAETGVPMIQLVREALEAHYQEERVA